MSGITPDSVQRIIGWLAALAFIALAGVSMMAPYELTIPVIAGLVVVIAMLLGKIDAISNLLDSYRGGGGE